MTGQPYGGSREQKIILTLTNPKVHKDPMAQGIHAGPEPEEGSVDGEGMGRREVLDELYKCRFREL